MKPLCIAALAALFAPLAAGAADFDKAFSDSTLRIDYMLSGKPGDVNIGLRHMHKWASWGGRKGHLKEAPYTGNGDITVTSLQGDTLYRNSFSTLFNEWLDLGDTTPSTCQLPLLVPYPKEKVVVTTRLLDKYHKVVAEATHTVDPADILIRNNQAPLLPHKYIRKGADAGTHVGIAFMGEGYRQEDMGQFYIDAEQAVDAILSHEPFKELQERIDFIAIETPSKDQGVSVPKKNEWKDTSFKSHYSTFYSDRYLTSPEVFAMYDALRGIPAQHIIVLVNTEEYGGGGIYNAYTLTSARHATARPVVVHEFGHSFGGLTDEYFYEEEVMSDTYPTSVEPWEPNITTLVDFDSKWKDMIPAGTPMPTDPKDAEKYPVGLYEGGGYSFHGVYRPADNCRMRINEIDAFCPVCQAALKRIILFYTED
ncbi:MAG: IgA Peptidase M64 [Bacteroidales bacterium]|nr:IgA Peptidase M64 [Bacteroidales bacterium]